MIKELIKDLVYDSISLSQGLTRAKLIAYKISNDTFKDWIYNELNGYSNPEILPDYRIIPCDLYGKINVPFQGTREIPIEATALDEWLNGKLYKMNVLQSVSTIEEGINHAKGKGQFGYENLTQGFVQKIREMTNSPELMEVHRRIQYSQMNHIINLTKQKLIDTLLELDKAFPNLEDDYQETTESSKEVSTIITTNIYGGNVNSNVGVGDEVIQKQKLEITNNIEEKLEEIRKIGVDEESIIDARKILNEEKDKTSLSKKLMNWAGKVSLKAVEKGIELNIPLLMEKIQDLF